MSDLSWLEQDVFPDPPEGSRHALDLIAQVRIRHEETQNVGSSILLIHVEIESQDRAKEIKSRLPFYYHFLRDKHQLPVLPVVLYLKVGLKGISTDEQIETLWDMEINRFRYLYVGLPGLDGVKYIQGANWLGVALAALMRIPREQVVWLGAEALRRLAESPLNEQQRFLLSECVQSCLPLDDDQRDELEQLLQTEPYEQVNAMNQTVYDKGRSEGRLEGQLEMAEALLQERFGPLPQTVQKNLQQLSEDELRQLVVKILSADSLTDLGFGAD